MAKCVRIWLEMGHVCKPRRSLSGHALAPDWRMWVRGARGDISAFVHKVVFKLDPPSAFAYPSRVLREPPYEIQESSSASIDIPIEVYLKYGKKPNKICLTYSLHIENNNKASAESKCVSYDFEDPSETLYKALIKSGGEVVTKTENVNKSKKLVNDSKGQKTLKTKRVRFVEPVRCKHQSKGIQKQGRMKICSKCSALSILNMRKQLRAVSMSEDEINHVSRLYTSYSNYEKSKSALILPPFSDPIYAIPELPASLRGGLTSIEAEYALR